MMLAVMLIDTAVTLWLLAHGRAIEGNPLMTFYVRQGLGFVMAAKLSLVVGPLTIMEWARRERPRLVRIALRFALVVYTGLFLLGLLRPPIPPTGF